jgi:hypothetical protein
MNELPMAIRSALRRLSRRLAIGLFLEVWPAWAVGGLVVAGVAALVCRIFGPGAALWLRWLWVTPVVAALPALSACVIQRYRPAEVIALADWLSGGGGLLLTVLENDDPAWTRSRMLEEAARFTLPRLRPWRRLAALPPAAAFLAAALWVPQRVPAPGGNAVLANDIAANLTGTLVELKQQALITPAEEQKLEEEIERLRRAAQDRVDASSWEAADAVRERLVSNLSGKRDAVRWAEHAVSRYAAMQSAGTTGDNAAALAAELTEALDKLGRSGLLAGAPADLQRLLKGGKLPADARSLGELTASLAKYLSETNGRFGNLGRLGREFGRFNPSEFPLESDSAASGGEPGQGAATRGRADAPLTWGKETSPYDRFKAAPLPPGAARSPDDWAPVAELPGAPQESPVAGVASTDRQYAAAAGQTAWRRSLAPRHQSAVKKYFAK